MNIIEAARKRGANKLSEHESKLFLAEHGVPVTLEKVVRTEDEAAAAARGIGYPVVLKGSGAEFTHKTELNLIALDIRDENEVRNAYRSLTSSSECRVNEVLVQQMIKGDRELMVGLTRDSQFGPCVMFGLGGIFAEILKDVSFRIAPLTRWDAMEMMEDIQGKKILDSFRGKPPVDREALANILVSIGQIGVDYDQISEIDINPLKILNGAPVAVDALFVLNNESNPKPEN
jgi:acetyl-CoA synthetase (ADP-forming)